MRKKTSPVTFNGQTRLSSELSYDFTLVATVTNVAMLDWPEALSSNATVSGDLNIATFGMVDLDISDKSTRTMSEGDETKISSSSKTTATMTTRFRSPSPTPLNLKKQASFPAGTFVAEDVVEDGISTVRELTIRAPSEVAADERFRVTFQAASGNDDQAPVSESSISIQLEASNTAGGLGAGLEEVDKDTLVMYGSIGAAVLFGLISLLRSHEPCVAEPMLNPCTSLLLKWTMSPKRRRTLTTWTSQNLTTCFPMRMTMTSTMFSLTL